MSSEDPRGRFGGEQALRPPEEAPELSVPPREVRRTDSGPAGPQAIRGRPSEPQAGGSRDSRQATPRRPEQTAGSPASAQQGPAPPSGSAAALGPGRLRPAGASPAETEGLREGSRTQGDVCSPRHWGGGHVGKRTAPMRDPGHVTPDTPSTARPALRDPGRVGVSNRAWASSARGVLRGLSLERSGAHGDPLLPACAWVRLGGQGGRGDAAFPSHGCHARKVGGWE